MNRTTVATLAALSVCALGAGPVDLGKEIVDAKMARMAQGQADWMKSMTPGKAHEFLSAFVGEWVTSADLIMGRDAPPMNVTWHSKTEMVMGGRYLESRATGQMMGMDVDSLMILGYDNVRQLFHMTMFDSMSTGVRTLYGNLDETGRVLTFVGAMDEPMTGEVGKPFKVVWAIVDDNRHTYEIQEILYGEPFAVIRADVRRKGD